MNVLRLGLHPQGIAPRVVNYAEWRSHLLSRLGRQIHATADPKLMDLLQEVAGYPGGSEKAGPDEYGGVLVPLTLRTDAGVLNLFSTTTIFGTPVDITLAELAVESFFPADEATAAAFQKR